MSYERMEARAAELEAEVDKWLAASEAADAEEHFQGYNAQAAVDATAQVIVAHGLDAKQSDQHQLVPMTDAIVANLGQKPVQLSADAGLVQTTPTLKR